MKKKVIKEVVRAKVIVEYFVDKVVVKNGIAYLRVKHGDGSYKWINYSQCTSYHADKELNLDEA